MTIAINDYTVLQVTAKSIKKEGNGVEIGRLRAKSVIIYRETPTGSTDKILEFISSIARYKISS